MKEAKKKKKKKSGIKIISLSLVLLFDFDSHLGVSFLGYNTFLMVIVKGNGNQTASLNSENKED